MKSVNVNLPLFLMGVLRKSVNLTIFQEECKPANLPDGGSEEQYKPVYLLDGGSEEECKPEALPSLDGFFKGHKTLSIV